MTTTATAETVAAARLLLQQQMGIAPADLLACPPEAPTFAEFVPQVRTPLSPGMLRTYDTHLKRLEAQWPDRRLDEPSQREIEDMTKAVQAGPRTNRAARGGVGTAQSFQHPCHRGAAVGLPARIRLASAR
jgi:hypothetical protein